MCDKCNNGCYMFITCFYIDQCTKNNVGLLQNNCQIKNSKYGIASKDASIAKIKKSEFIDNLIQLSTYKKNWRYNASGKIFLENSNLFSKEKNKLIGDKYGEINILSSTFEGSLIKEGNVFIN